jgi:glycosyltransferase involved in cell wall biosynthesis
VAALEAYVHRRLDLPQRVAALVAPSEFLKAKFVEFGWPAEKIHVLPNFLPEFPPETGSALEGHGLYLGTLLPTKGVDVLLRALTQTPTHPFHVLGDGVERLRLEKMAIDLGLADRVKFCGFLGGAELAREIEGAAYAVMPSVWYENGPYAALELMARGIPLIASAIGGIPELVRDGETGLLFPAGDAAALAERIDRLGREKNLGRTLGRQARRFIAEKCAVPEYARRLFDVYAEAGRKVGNARGPA